jgi:Secretion system C-terminal sorting domain
MKVLPLFCVPLGGAQPHNRTTATPQHRTTATLVRVEKLIAVFSAFFLVFLQVPISAQNNPTVIEWNYSTPSTIPGFELDDNWAQSIIQTSDGNFVACGFSDKYNSAQGITTGIRHPAVLKYNPGRTIVWEKIPSHQLNPQIPISGGGGFNDLIETTEAGIKYIYACGQITRANATYGRIAVIAKFRLDDGNVMYYKEHAIGTSANLFRMQPIPSASSPTHIMVVGKTTTSADPQERGTLYKFTTAGDLVTAFGVGGFKRYTASMNPGDTDFRDIAIAPNGDFFLAGSLTLSGNYQVQRNRDAWVLRVNSSGALLWEKCFTEVLAPGYADIDQANETPYCIGTVAPATTETGNEEAWAIEVMSDGNLAILARFDFIELSAQTNPPGPNENPQNMPAVPGATPNPNDCFADTPLGPNGCWPFNTEQYYDCDLALVKINATSGNLLYSKDVGRSVAVDNWAFMARSGNTLYVMASKFIVDNNNSVYGEKILGSVIKVEDQLGVQFNTRWRKDSDVQLSFEFCPFGICMAQDGGVVLCGNNHCNGDDYEFIKFAPDCQVNSNTFNTPSTDINLGQTITWNTLKVINGTIKVKSGGHLIIQNTTIKFMNTYLTNDWYKLRDGLGIPSKIIVEEGGKLTLDNSTLTGVLSCGKDCMWEGIEVYGQPTQIPGTTLQGLVVMKNNAVIKNAYKGIVAGDSYFNAQGRTVSAGTKGGGLVQCDQPIGSTVDHFLNCRRSVWFAPYTNTSAAPVVYFKNTNFKVNASNYLNDVNLVDANGVGVGFASMITTGNRDHITCTRSSFKNTAVGMLETARGTGIEGFDAKLTLNSCTFDRLYRGVYISNGIGINDPLTMNLDTLTNTRHNIEVLAGAFHNIQNCNINTLPAGLIAVPATNTLADPSYGIKFSGSKNLYCAGNLFNGTANDIYGMVTVNSGPNASDFFNNTFTQVDFGVQTEQFNQGLQIRCNQYTGNLNAWSINPQSGGSGQLSPQGICGLQTIQAGNVFNDPACSPPGSSEIHIKSTVPFAYSSRNSATYPLELPTCVTVPNITVTVNNCTAQTTNPNSCSASSGGCIGCKPGQSITENEMDQSIWLGQMTANHEIGRMLDDGKTDEVPDLIRKAFPEDKALLIGALINMQRLKEARAEIESLSSKESKGFFEMMCALAEQKEPRLSPDQQDQLQELVKSASELRYQAMAVLEQYTDLRFERPIEVWEKTEQKEASSERSDIKLLATQNDQITIYPNPAFDHITMRSNAAPIQSICLIDLMGRKLVNKQVNGLEERLQTDQLPAGVYLLQVECGNTFTTYKVVIQK